MATPAEHAKRIKDKTIEVILDYMHRYGITFDDIKDYTVPNRLESLHAKRRVAAHKAEFVTKLKQGREAARLKREAAKEAQEAS